MMQQNLIEEQKLLQFENLGDQYEQLQKRIDIVEDEEILDQRSELKKTINNLMNDLDDPVSGLNKS